MNENIITRFSPSPTGSLHLGGLRTALFSFAFAKKHNGKFFLRIEDTDRSRYVPNSDEEIKEILTNFNLHWDNPHVLYQSKNLFSYFFAAESLIKTGHAYKCYCPIDYSDECKCSELKQQVSNNTPFCVKLRMPTTGTIECKDELRGTIMFECSKLKDIVLIKQDRYPTYHLASIVDDISMGVTHVFRGEEWISSMPYHVWLYNMLFYRVPKFYHLPLILDPVNNCKLSKRNNNASVKNYLDMGIPKEAILNYISALGYSPDCEFFTLDGFVSQFSTDRISTHNACFDIDKLKFYSKTYLNLLSDVQILNSFNDYNFNIIKNLCDPLHAISIFRPEVSTLSELFDKLIDTIINPDFDVKFNLNERVLIQNFVKYLESKDIPPTTEEIQLFIKEHNLSNKDFHPVIRRALTSSVIGYQIHDIIRILGVDEVTSRLLWFIN